MAPTFVIGYGSPARGADAIALGVALGEFADAQLLVASALARRQEPGAAGDDPVSLQRRTSELRSEVGELLVGQDWEARAVVGQSAGAALRELAEYESAHMIVLGSARSGAVGGTLLGPASAEILSGAPCATAVAPRGYAARRFTDVAKVGVAFDGSAESERALEAAIEIAEPLSARITLCAVLEPPSPDAADAAPRRPSLLAGVGERRAIGLLERALAWMPARASAEPRVIASATAPALAALSDEVDLVVIGSGGSGPRRRTFAGGTARALLATSRCPVIVAPRGASDEPRMFRGGFREGGSALVAGPGLGAD